MINENSKSQKLRKMVLVPLDFQSNFEEFLEHHNLRKLYITETLQGKVWDLNINQNQLDDLYSMKCVLEIYNVSGKHVK
jgi:hypothetical protein